MLDTSSAEYKKTQRLFEKTQTLRRGENRAKQELQDKLDGLLQIRELAESGDYKKQVESEINHLKRILAVSQDIEKKMR